VVFDTGTISYQLLGGYTFICKNPIIYTTVDWNNSRRIPVHIFEKNGAIPIVVITLFPSSGIGRLGGCCFVKTVKFGEELFEALKIWGGRESMIFHKGSFLFSLFHRSRYVVSDGSCAVWTSPLTIGWSPTDRFPLKNALFGVHWKSLSEKTSQINVSDKPTLWNLGLRVDVCIRDMASQFIFHVLRWIEIVNLGEMSHFLNSLMIKGGFVS
jgi:hypothetical protein